LNEQATDKELYFNMTTIFFFYVPSIFEILVLILNLLAYVFLILTGNKLKHEPNEFKYFQFFVMSGILLFLWKIVFLFIPQIDVHLPTSSEIILGFNYNLFKDFITFLFLLISYGLFFTTIGVTNMKLSGKYVLFFGILQIIHSFMLFLINTMLNRAIFSGYSTYISFIGLYYIISWFLRIIWIISILILLTYSYKINQKYLSYTCILLMTTTILDVVFGFLASFLFNTYGIALNYNF